MTTRALHPDQFGDPSTIPPEYGTQAIPEGMVRFHHYTRSPEQLRSIRETGLREEYARESFARGGTEFPQTFATTGTPDADFKHGHYYVEGYANPSQDPDKGQLDIGRGRTAEDLTSRRSTITFHGDVPAHQIIGAHQPWHEHARYIERERGGPEAKPGEDPYATGSMRSGVARGEYDYLEKDPNLSQSYGPAIRSVKITNAATTMLGGKL